MFTISATLELRVLSKTAVLMKNQSVTMIPRMSLVVWIRGLFNHVAVEAVAVLAHQTSFVQVSPKSHSATQVNLHYFTPVNLINLQMVDADYQMMKCCRCFR